MLRARAYLHLGNVDNSKRDLAAILRNDPEHTSAKGLHRQLRRFAKGIDDGAKLVATRQWADALERFQSAASAISPTPDVEALLSGMLSRKAEGPVAHAHTHAHAHARNLAPANLTPAT